MNDTTALKALESELHVWIAYPDNASVQHLIEQFLPLLNQEEQDRYRRFHFDHDRHTYLAAHALVRITLSRYASCEPAQWRFTRGAQGKPEIEAKAGLPALRFNLSHTKGMVSCAVALNRVCGVDVERIRPMKDMVGIAETVFSDAEVSFLHSLDAANWPDSFFKLWTLKEAYIKAIGQGLAAPLKEITFDIEAPFIRASFNGEELNNTGWQFHHWKPVTTHHLAVAAQSIVTPTTIVYHELNLGETLENCLQHSCSNFRLHDAM
ncbi:MAG: 4'-phosphopantetheinyl transferase family protein [Burkholderiaceae bacterium]